MQLKFSLLSCAVMSVAYGQTTISFNASQIVTDLENLTNLAKLTSGIAGNITLGNIGGQLPGLVTSITTGITTIVADAVHIAVVAGNSVLDVTDQATICLSLSELIASELDTINSISSISFINAPPLNGIVAAVITPLGALVAGLVNTLLPHIPDCVSTSQVDLNGLETAVTNLLRSLGLPV